MLKYGKIIQFDPKVFDPLNIDRQSIESIPDHSRVLEIGCATGFAGEYLIKQKDCYVVGVDVGKDEAAIAKKRLNKVIVGDIEDSSIQKSINEKFDIVYASALVEHLKDPWAALTAWRKFLKKDGQLVITTSNIAHWSMRIKLMKGNFNYEPFGILDNTHLRFFTYNSFKKAAESSGYTVLHYKIDAVGGGYPKVSKFMSQFYPNIFAYQMLIVARQK
jgi:SAM-dependent methyltransferase